MKSPVPSTAIHTDTESGRRVHPAVVVVIGLAMVMVLMVGAGLWQLRRDTISAQERTLSILASALADELERGLQGVTVALQALRDDLSSGRVVPGKTAATTLLQTRVNIVPLVRRLWFVDEQGRTIAGSRDTTGPVTESFLPALTSLAENGVALSAPYLDPTQNLVVVTLAVRTLDAKGRRAGWVMADVASEDLQGAFSKVDLGPSARMEILRSDGMRLAGHLGTTAGSPDPSIDKDSPVQATTGLASFDDGSLRLLQERALEHFPVELVITRDVRQSLSHWKEVAQFAGTILAAVLTALAILLVRMLRAERARRSSQRALLAGRERAALAFDAAQAGNWDWTPDSSQVYLSPRMKELMGLPGDSDLAGISLERWCSAMDPADAAQLKAALQTQTDPAAAPIDMSLRVKRSDGRGEWVRLRGTASRDGGGRAVCVAGVAFDVTAERERAAHTRRLEAQLARKRKLESLGTLAGSVAHDFNNILAAVVGYGELARQAAAEGSTQARHIDQVLQAGLRGKSVVERILAFSRSGSRPHTVFAVQPVVEQVLDLLAATANSGILVVRRLSEVELYVRGDATQLFEATMNLCTNALQAMHGRGTLTVALGVLEVDDERWLSHGRLARGSYVALSVADTGEGIAAETMEQLFEPFFTTRNVGTGTGTGLGLAVVHGVVEHLGGAVDVASTPGLGSTFTLYFPRTEDTRAKLSPSVQTTPPGHGQTILVVDDERTLVELAEELLAQMGYEPVGFTDAQDAFNAFQAEPQRFDAVLTDEVMPGMSGTELAGRIHEMRADLPILLVSGYGGPQLVQRARAAGIRRVLAKPLQSAELARNLAEVLQRSAP